MHIILIFDCESRLSELTEDFNVTMYRKKAKAKEAPETIYWDFNDIVEFANEHDALISIHAGRKESWGRKRMAEKISVTVRYIRNHADTWTGNPHLSSVWKSADHLS